MRQGEKIEGCNPLSFRSPGGELETELTIEKRRVSELEAYAHALDLSRQVAAAIERHSNTALEVPSRSRAHEVSTDKNGMKVSDDSGYTDGNSSLQQNRDKVH
ncbi:unnamed protein product [Diatraea saccharalis]|uniref:Uncharacterized protein n=1 Tax=Diatraea saccharalis TaxID=40085 RepID=A0A9N9RIG4_9NEOP|nr:unnamed protein product [Diatraea saccharalis]